MKKWIILLIITLLYLGFMSKPFMVQGSGLERYARNYFDYFGSVVNVQLWSADDIDHAKLFDEIDDLLEEVHQVSTHYDLYSGVVNIKYINQNPDIIHTVHPMLIDMITLSLHYYNHELGGQKFNIALGSVLNIWSEYRNRCLDTLREETPDCQLPPIEALEAGAVMTDPNAIVFDAELNTVLIPEGMQLDLGGIAKGYGAKMVSDYLRAEGIEVFVVNAGSSNIEFFGPHHSGERDYWLGGLRNPFNPKSSYAQVKLQSGENLVTSGDYEKYYPVDGKDYHHIIDPETLFPSYHIRSTTIISLNPVLGDIYSTIAFILPLDEAITFIDSLDDVEAIWVTEDGHVHYSANFEAQYLVEVSPPYQSFEDDDGWLDPLLVSLFGMLGLITAVFVFVVIKEQRKTKKIESMKNPEA